MMKKRIFSVLLCLCMVLALFPATAFAEDVPRIEITITGFEVGSTPVNCQITEVTSTISEAGFSTKDVEIVSWYKCTDEGTQAMNSTEEFEADKAYKCSIKMPSTGGVSASNVMVNGITGQSEITEVDSKIVISFDFGNPLQQYTVTYDPGNAEGVMDQPPMTDIKIHGEDLTLRGETFTRKGYKQIGWSTDDSWNYYDLGGKYSTDANVTLYPVWDEIITLKAPFTTTVKLGGNVAPGETTFTLEVFKNRKFVAQLDDGETVDDVTFDDVTVSGSAVTTNGAGDYKGTLTITGPSDSIYAMLDGDIFVRQVNEGKSNWTYDNTVWALVCAVEPQMIALDLDNQGDDEDQNNLIPIFIYPTTYEDIGDGEKFYYPKGNPVDDNKMSFTNIYTENYYIYIPTEPPKPTEPELTEPEPTEPEPTEPELTEPTEPAEPTESIPDTVVEDDVPKTGDDSNMILWIALLLASGFGATGAVVYSKRKKYVK